MIAISPLLLNITRSSYYKCCQGVSLVDVFFKVAYYFCPVVVLNVDYSNKTSVNKPTHLLQQGLNASFFESAVFVDHRLYLGHRLLHFGLISLTSS